MKNKKLTKNSFMQGTIIASAAIILIKVLGALYVIPFYRIVGEDGGTLYSYAYSIYNLFLNVSTAGIPIAISMIISEYLALEMYDAKERSYKVGKIMISILAIVAFSFTFFGSSLLAKFILSDTVGGHSIEDVSLVIKSISFCLLVIPFLSILRGYMQGHKYIAPTSTAQVIEQVARILVVIVGSYAAIRLFNTSTTYGVCVALLGTFLGGLIAYIYLKIKFYNCKNDFPKSEKKDKVKDSVLAKKILLYCIPLVIVAITDNLYTLIDVKLIIKGLTMVGYETLEAETISSILATWSPKICAIIGAIATALTTNVIPHVTSAFVCKDMKTVTSRINQAISTVLIVTIPMALLLFLLSNEAYFLFYGNSNYGGVILKFTAIINIFFALNTVLNSSLQSMKKFKNIYICTIVGLASNAILDIPMILLLNKLGLDSFVGTAIATIIGYIISISITVRFLSKKLNIDFSSSIKTSKKIILPLLVTGLVIGITKHFLGFDYTITSAFINLFCYGFGGVAIYLFMVYKNGGLLSVFGEEYLTRILKKLHLKK